MTLRSIIKPDGACFWAAPENYYRQIRAQVKKAKNRKKKVISHPQKEGKTEISCGSSMFLKICKISFANCLQNRRNSFGNAK